VSFLFFFAEKLGTGFWCGVARPSRTTGGATRAGKSLAGTLQPVAARETGGRRHQPLAKSPFLWAFKSRSPAHTPTPPALPADLPLLAEEPLGVDTPRHAVFFPREGFLHSGATVLCVFRQKWAVWLRVTARYEFMGAPPHCKSYSTNKTPLRNCSDTVKATRKNLLVASPGP
jgi:hypothetical protein